MLNLLINRENHVPLHQQIRDQIIHLISRDILKKGNQLPSSRDLANSLKVNRTTVYRAYRDLWALGYTESRPGSYSVVRDRKKINQPVDRDSDTIDWDSLLNSNPVTFKTVPVPDKTMFDFRTFSPASIKSAVENYRKCLNDVMKEKGSELLQYGEVMGYKPLREYISQMMSVNKVDTDLSRILITDGAQKALDLLCRLFAKPEWTIVTEEPTYSEALSLFRFYGARILPVPIGPDGMDTEILRQILHNNNVSFIYTMPNYQNPTGISSTQQNREELLDYCEKARVPIIEDGFSEDMRGTILPIKSMDKNGIVLYVGTFSKVLFPGIRTGWINGNHSVIKRLAALQYMSSVSGNMVMQAGLDRFCRLGYYDLHLKKIHNFYRKRMSRAMNSLNEHFPVEAADFTSPAGGYYIWFRFSAKFSDEELLIGILKSEGILMTGGSIFSSGKKGVNLRMSIAHVADEKLEEGLVRFCAVIKGLL
jgi:GntR family transcriptional regulator/MocR family aminotransferase